MDYKKYIDKFESTEDIQTAIDNGELNKPYVALVESGNVIDWNTKSKSVENTMTLTFKAQDRDGEGRFKVFSNYWDGEDPDSEEFQFTAVTYNGVDILGECGIDDEVDPIDEEQDLKVYYIDADLFEDADFIGEVSEYPELVFHFAEGRDSISDFTFSDCPIRTIDIPSFVREIGSYSFAWASPSSEVTSIILNEGLEVIGDRAFEGVELAGSALTIPSTVTSVEINAFNLNLKDVEERIYSSFTWYILPTTPPELDNDECCTFGNPTFYSDYNISFVYPSGSTGAYAQTVWIDISICDACEDWEEMGYSSWEECRCGQYGDECPDECEDWENMGYESYEDCRCQLYEECGGESCEDQGLCDDGEGNCVECEEPEPEPEEEEPEE